MRALFAAVLVVLVGFAAAGCGGSGTANAGLIAFVSWKTGKPEIWVVKPDGTGLKQLTRLDSADAFAWSTDGRKLLFWGTTSRKGGDGLYEIRPDGSGLSKLRGSVVPLAWSADRKKIAYPDSKGAVYVANVGGSGRRLVADKTFFVQAGGWSPDEKSLLLSKTTKAGDDIYVASLGGGAPKLVSTAGDFLASPVWSPDGRRIAFATSADLSGSGPLGGVATIRVDGSGMTRLTDGFERQPFWSPDGKALGFTGQNDIEVIELAGGRIGRVAPVADLIEQAAWSPAGDRIAYLTASPHPAKKDPAYEKLYVVGLDGSRPRLLADHLGYSSGFAWQPGAGARHAPNLSLLPVTAGEWVGTFCRSMKHASKQFASLGPAVLGFAAKLKDTRKLDLKAAKKVLVEVFAGGARAFRAVEAAVRAEGAPATGDGARLQAVALSVLNRIARIFDTGAQGIGSLPTTSKKAFSKAGDKVIKALQAQIERLQAAGNRMAKLSTKAIDDAMSSNPDCSGGFFGG